VKSTKLGEPYAEKGACRAARNLGIHVTTAPIKVVRRRADLYVPEVDKVLVYSATKMGWITRLGQYVNEFCSTTPLDSTMIDGTADLMHFRTCAPSMLYCVESAPANTSIKATSSRQDKKTV